MWKSIRNVSVEELKQILQVTIDNDNDENKNNSFDQEQSTMIKNRMKTD